MSHDLTVAEIDSMSVVSLREKLREAGLKLGGSKPELQKRCKRLVLGQITEVDKPKRLSKSNTEIGQKRKMDGEKETSKEPSLKKTQI